MKSTFYIRYFDYNRLFDMHHQNYLGIPSFYPTGLFVSKKQGQCLNTTSLRTQNTRTEASVDPINQGCCAYHAGIHDSSRYLLIQCTPVDLRHTIGVPGKSSWPCMYLSKASFLVRM